jgi:hypothetical protein
MEQLPMLSVYVTTTLIALCVLLVAWYFLGMWFNRRRGIHLAHSLRDRLNALGAEELTGRWLNTSIFQFSARRATSPIGKLAAIIVLESRELLLIWLVNLLRGRRDLLVLRMDLRSTPRAGLELEAHPKQTKPEPEIRRRIAESGWEQATAGDYMIYHQHGAAHLKETLAPLLEEWRPYLQRLSISTSSPHLLLSFSPALPVLEKEARFTAVQKLAEAILKRQGTTDKR